jgi:hypothetical protein
MATGRTAGKYVKFTIEDGAADPGTMRDIPVNSFGSVGLTFAEQDVSSLQEELTKILNGQGGFSTTISGPFDNTAAVAESGSAARAALSGSHTVLSVLNGGNLPKTFAIYIGIQGYWVDTVDPVFGAENSVLISDYTVDMAAGTYSAKIVTAGNRTNDPDWGVALLHA